MNGDEITFVAGGQTYTGKVKGNRDRGNDHDAERHAVVEREQVTTQIRSRTGLMCSRLPS